MNDQPQISRPDSTNSAATPTFAEPGVPHIRTLNVPGMHALYVKEVHRFFKVQLQTIWAPAITTL
ncbi:MAG: ABC transporter permease, partial [Sphingopyxis sp.]